MARLPIRFRLRTLLVLVALVAVVCAWIGRYALRVAIQRPIVPKIAAAGGNVYYDYQIAPSTNRIDLSRTPPGSSFVRGLLGDDIYAAVSVVFLSDAGATDADVAMLTRLPELRDVSLRGRGFTDASIEDLLRVPCLRSLVLQDTSITAKGIQRLSRSKSLRSMLLTGRNIRDDHLQHVADFPQLHFLQFLSPSITDSGLRSLAEMKRLTGLCIVNAPRITDTGIETLLGREELVELKLLNTSVTDRALDTIRTLPSLRILHLLGPITDDGFKHLSSLTQLEAVNLDDTQLSDEGLAALAHAQNLRFLEVQRTRITDKGMKYLGSLHALEYLDVGDTLVTDAGLKELEALRSLKHVGIGINQGMTMKGVEALKAALPNCQIDCWEYASDGSGTLMITK